MIPIDDGAFAVEVSIPERHPAKVSPFATKADAEAWIADHRRRVQSEHEPSASPTSKLSWMLESKLD